METMTMESLEINLPHGSGIDCTWEIEDMGNYFKVINSYHCMNENGYYVGYSDFSVTIPKKNREDFKLHFHGSHSQYRAKKFMLREYLEDIIYDFLTD